MKPPVKRSLIAIAAVAALIQLVPVHRTNPPVTSDIATSGEVHAILRRACYDCHSNETRWPWYSHVAPVSWLLARDVSMGRRHMNFSEWGQYTSDKQDAKIQSIWEQVSHDQMPLWFYRPLHPAAKLTDADRAVLQAWATPAPDLH
ncbi:MAG TPA: heme-binding domain-containing protein [Candidatus Polarisedimenticolaceae bacterium]|nr:heme-binding domain-containing protein [Candidatus Polarisedimenticolaceae bacterium]